MLYCFRSLRVRILGAFLAAVMVAGCGATGDAPSGSSPDASTGTKLPALAPAIVSVSPSRIPVGGGTTIVVTGRNLRGAQVEVNGEEVAVSPVVSLVAASGGTLEQVQFEAPPKPAGPVVLVVKNSNGFSESADSLEYIAVDPCADSAPTTPQLFPPELIQDDEGPLLYDPQRDRLLLGLGTQIFYREGEGAWKILKETYNPVTDMELDAERGLLFIKSSGEGAGGTPFLTLMQLDLSTAALSTITPTGLVLSKCNHSDLAYDPASGQLFLSCTDRVMRRSAAGQWSLAATNSNVGGNEFASLVAGTGGDGTTFVCAGVKTPTLVPPTTDGVYCQEDASPWTLVPNTAWHENFPYFPQQSLLFDPATSEIFSIVRDQDSHVLIRSPGEGWKELFSLPTPHLPSQAVLDPTSGRLYVTDESCTLSYFDGQWTEIGSLGGPLTTFGYSSCAGKLALNTARGILYMPSYTNTCEANDGLCPRLTDVVGVCLAK